MPLTAPQPEDLFAATSSYLEIILTATDSAGVSASTSRSLDPRKVTLSFDTVPSGMSVRVNGVDLETPAQVVSWHNWQIPIAAFDQTFHGASYDFSSWTDGGAQTHDIVTPAAATQYRASFTPLAGNDFFLVTPCRLVDSRGGAAWTGSRTYTLTGRCGIPITATALALNVTAIQPTANGYLVLHPGGTPVPAASALNYRAGKTRANNAVATLNDAGELTVTIAGGSLHVAVDVFGYFE